MSPGIETAREAGLRYVSDIYPGLGRRREGDGFVYLDPLGQEITDEETLARIRKLAIPPAWSKVWISADPQGHIQATGRDARGRKQYRYHERWRHVRDQNKYDRMIEFAHALPGIRRRVDRDMRRRGLAREKVLATVVRLLETTMIRVGNEEYAQKNRSFGLTTLRDRHVKVRGHSAVRFYFRGKSGKEHRVTIRNQAIARVVKQCQELPGQELFQYLGADGERRRVTSDDVNEYLRETTGRDFTAKDFRTWAGTVLAARALRELEQFDSQAQAKRNLVRAIENVARELGNTRDVCRRCYVHPAVVDAYMDGTMAETLRIRAEEAMQSSMSRLQPEEAAVLALLQQRLKQESRQAA
jgi:DNA topoisomerase I